MVINCNIMHFIMKLDQLIVISQIKSSVCRLVNCSLEMDGESIIDRRDLTGSVMHDYERKVSI